MPLDPPPSDPLRDTSEEVAPAPSTNGQGPVPTATEAPVLPERDADMDTDELGASSPDSLGPQPSVLSPPLAEDGDAITSELEQVGTSPLDTTPLDKSEEVAGPMRPLQDRDMAGGRYRIVEFLGNLTGTNIYRTTDMQAYRQCWACGSTASMEGETYCVECGAQLTGRYYRLQEFALPASWGQGAKEQEPEVNGSGDVPAADPLAPTPDEAMPVPHVMSASIIPVPQPMLANAVHGVLRVYDTFVDTILNRAYVVWEEIYGRTLASWLPGGLGETSLFTTFPPITSGQLINIDEPGDEQAMAWMAQAADLLASMHTHGVVGCNITLDNLVVQPGDRIVLVNPTECSLLDEEALGAVLPAVQTSDVRNLAIHLEQWYLAVRPTPIVAAPGAGAPPSPNSGLIIAVDEVTGPLNKPSNAVSVLTKAKEGAYASASEFAEALYDLYESSRPVTNLLLWSGRATDVGQVRQINEDSVLTLEVNVLEHEGNTPMALYVIADGMGGHQSGEVASSIAVRTIGALVNQALIQPLMAGDPVACDADTCASLLQQAVLEANRRIADLARERHSDLGTTVTTALVIGNLLTVANVGDSRTYLWRDDELGVITRDHSLVAQLVAAGQIAPGDIYTHPRRNEIYRALGDPRLTVDEIDTFKHQLLPGDGILLCSDGLWDFVRDPIINAIIDTMQPRDPQAVCQSLIDRANSMGGEDNISTIFVRVLAPKVSE